MNTILLNDTPFYFNELHLNRHLDSEELQVPLPTLTVPKFLSHNDSKGPCYTG